MARQHGAAEREAQRLAVPGVDFEAFAHGGRDALADAHLGELVLLQRGEHGAVALGRPEGEHAGDTAREGAAERGQIGADVFGAGAQRAQAPAVERHMREDRRQQLGAQLVEFGVGHAAALSRPTHAAP